MSAQWENAITDLVTVFNERISRFGERMPSAIPVKENATSPDVQTFASKVEAVRTQISSNITTTQQQADAISARCYSGCTSAEQQIITNLCAAPYSKELCAAIISSTNVPIETFNTEFQAALADLDGSITKTQEEELALVVLRRLQQLY